MSESDSLTDFEDTDRPQWTREWKNVKAEREARAEYEQ